MTDAGSPVVGAARRVALLAGQAFALGLMLSWITIPASALFLSTYGADLLPVTYLCAALAAVVSSAGLSAALRRRPLAMVATRVLLGTSGVLALTWLFLTREVLWLSFGLLVLVPIVVPMGFMLLVGQAGLLLDVRALKTLYPRVIAGFALGFVVGGLAAPPLLSILGRTEHLVAGAAAAAGLWVGLLTVTRRQFIAELSGVDQAEVVDREAAPTWGTLLRHRYVLFIVAFQMLSAVESQWLDYLVYARAAERYEDSQQLALFVSRFTAIAYGADILFLLLVAGLLMRRFGLRYGLAANPGAVLAVVGAVVALSAFQGAGATVVFVLIVAARVTDLVLADGAARTSLSAAYQVVPTPLRLAAQAGVEGLAVPVAIGASGVVLLVLQASVGTTGIVLPVLVAAVVAVWLVVAALVHRSYRTSLLASLRFRTLDPATLSMDDANSLAVADRLLASEHIRDVRLGLDTLTQVAHPALADRLVHLTSDARAVVRADALDRLSRLDVPGAVAAARQGLRDPDPGMRARCVQVLTVIGDSSDLPAVEVHRRDTDPQVRVAVFAALTHLGDESTQMRVATEVAVLAISADPAERVLAARALGACEGAIDRTPLRALVVDADDDVANGSLDAVRWPEDAALLATIAGRLGDRATASAAARALVRAGPPALDAVEDGLVAGGADRRVQVLLARVARDVGGPSAVDALVVHVDHPDREVGLAVLTALGELVAAATNEGWEHEEVDVSLVVLADVEHATHALRAIAACDAHPAARGLSTALDDELSLLRRRVLAGLAANHGAEALERVTFQFSRGDRRSHALAVEWLDVTLTGTDRAAVPLVEPGLPASERRRQLNRTFPLPDMSFRDVLVDLIADPDERWREPWTRACAVYAAWADPAAGLDPCSVGIEVPLLDLDGEPSIVVETLEVVRARARPTAPVPVR